MGMRTEMQTEAWQKAFGIQPATGEVGDAWRRLQDVCFEAIKVAELEKSGIRDGDGRWHGSDVIGHTLNELQNVCACLWAAYNPPDDEDANGKAWAWSADNTEQQSDRRD
jgi:hypothetical protein